MNLKINTLKKGLKKCSNFTDAINLIDLYVESYGLSEKIGTELLNYIIYLYK